MTSGQLQTIEEIFHAALARAPAEVDAFLETACAGDKILRAQVEKLIASHQQAGHFIETPAIALAPQILQHVSPGRSAGERIGHYEISQRIGAGGMGEVYLATDLVAGRKAALKLLPARFTGDPGRVRRFEREARAVVALNHPNILTVYEIGEQDSAHYIASELIDGETLRQRLSRGPLPVIEALDVATQVASALVAAHSAGIVHRDIKPENIMLRPDGYVKVLDFGIAKLSEKETSAPADDEVADLAATRLGSTVGTARYMSPEQVRGDALDHRSDIWSLGVVLYEMVTGRAPFHGDKPAETAAAILETEPSIAEIPGALRQIIGKTLRKHSAERYSSAGELIGALKMVRRQMDLAATSLPSPRRWRIAAAALLLLGLALALTFSWPRHKGIPLPPPEKSIAVLPFENLGANPDDADFTAGVQEEILSGLAKIADLKVISRTSARLYEAGKPRNARQIGEELGVAHLLEGSVQREGHRLRIKTHLIETRTQSHLWSEVYEREVSDLSAVQSEIARTIAGRLDAKISVAEKAALARPPTSDLVASDLFQKASIVRMRTDSQSQFEAIKLLEQAVARDPHFLRAYCALAGIHLFLYEGNDHTAARLRTAQETIEQAARLQPDAGEVNLIRARYLARGLRDYDQARGELELARRTLPNDPAVYFELGLMDRRQGRWAEALRNFERALELDPRNVNYLMPAADISSSMRRYGDAVRYARRGLALSPRDRWLRLFLATQPRDERADLRPYRREIDALLADDPQPSTDLAEAAWRCAILERNEAAAERALATIPAGGIPGYLGFVAPREWYAGFTARVFNRPETAHAALMAARVILEKQLEETPESGLTWSLLGQVKAALGEKEGAIEAGQRACEIWPLTTEPLWGRNALVRLAIIYAWVGETDLALQNLRLSAKEPSTITYGDLKLHPSWDPLRGDPRFEEIVASLTPPP